MITHTGKASYDRLWFATALIISIMPLWIPDFLPLVDIPQHAAQLADLRELAAGNSFFRDNFAINWLTPYMGGYLLMYLASLALPVVAATKLVASLAVVGVPLATGLLLREAGADQRLKWLAIPAGYSFGFYWGFLVYVVAVPVALLFLWSTIRYDREPSLKRALAMAGFSVALFFCHAMALGFASAVAVAWLFARHWRTPLTFIRRALPFLTPVPLIVLWTLRVNSREASVQDGIIQFAPFRQKMVVLFNQLAGLDGTSFMLSLLIAATVILLPLLAGCRPSRRPERWLPLVVGLALYLVFPHYMQATAYLYQRLAVFLVPLWLLVWDAPTHPRRFVLPVGATCVLLLWAGFNTQRFVRFADESASFSQVLRKAEPGHRMAGMMFCNSSDLFALPVYLHFHAWYGATSRGIADNSFALTLPSPVRYRDLQAPRIGDTLGWRPGYFEWERHGGDSYDYFLVCAVEDVSVPLFKDRAGAVQLLAHAGPWWLYEKRGMGANP
jgi:hypothetical protein